MTVFSDFISGHCGGSWRGVCCGGCDFGGNGRCKVSKVIVKWSSITCNGHSALFV